ncbi:MAG: DUF1460 domain-containing protein [Verrucomicrobia bacterium]|nr:DUF1460 domain-containing protein [Verrucomicrobiota bacterium]
MIRRSTLLRILLLLTAGLLFSISPRAAVALPFDTVFKGRDRFDRLVTEAAAGNWSALPIGERTATVGRALTGTPYRGSTLEIDDRVEAPSANLLGLDCWTFFETSLAFARMLGEPRDKWTPETLLRYLELDRYRGGHCTGSYLSRLHYLEDWAVDNQRRGLVEDLTRSLGGVAWPHSAQEMSILWRHYRYLRADPSLLPELRQMEDRVSTMPLYGIPVSRVAGIEGRLRDGDIIGIITRDSPGAYSTSHVGLAVRQPNGTLCFLHASAPHNYGRVLIESRLASYVRHYRTDAAIMVFRPVR